LVGARREKGDNDRGKSHRDRTVRPFGNDPEKRDGADHNECAPGIDQRRKPIGDAEAAGAAIPSNRPGRIGNEQSQPI